MAIRELRLSDQWLQGITTNPNLSRRLREIITGDAEKANAEGTA